MLKHRWTDRICCLVLALTLALTCALLGAASAGEAGAGRTMGYEDRLFDQTRVHSIEIIMDDWEGFLETCTNEEYSVCTVVIDGEAYGNVGIRAKGNTSLSSVAAYGNNRYSFKVEFDQYSPGGSYYGLDKLSLNNTIQDATCMKDYFAYTMMNEMGVAAPLCSFANISVNGEAWGLYLAVEAVEDAFLMRSYGADSGELYKPDSMSFGGGRGNGRDFDMEAFADQFSAEAAEGSRPALAEAFAGGAQPEGMGIPQQPQTDVRPEGAEVMAPDGSAERLQRAAAREGMDRSAGGRGSSDVKLQYIDDDPASYSNIFSNAKTDVTEADQQRLIDALKRLGEGDSSAVDAESVIRYFVVHDFMCNGDSYTGTMIHNYYLHEADGVLEMIPWDYNLSLGAFGMGMDSSATSAVNSPIDSPVTGGDVSDRPMAAWIFADEAHTQRYHEVYAELIEKLFDSGWFVQKLDDTAALIAPCVEADPTAFYSYEAFCAGVEAMREFCLLRAQSVAGQLEGTIPSTTEGQRTAQDALIDASHIALSDMGSMGGGREGGMGAFRQPGTGTENSDAGFPGSEVPADGSAATSAPDGTRTPFSGGGAAPFAGQPPEGMPGTPGDTEWTMEGITGQTPEAAGWSADMSPPVPEMAQGGTGTEAGMPPFAPGMTFPQGQQPDAALAAGDGTAAAEGAAGADWAAGRTAGSEAAENRSGSGRTLSGGAMQSPSAEENTLLLLISAGVLAAGILAASKWRSRF